MESRRRATDEMEEFETDSEGKEAVLVSTENHINFTQMAQVLLATSSFVQTKSPCASVCQFVCWKYLVTILVQSFEMY